MLFNAGQMFMNRAQLSPDLDACIGDGYRYTFRQANQRLNRFANFLAAKGIRQGDRIAVLCKNNEHVTTALFGAAKAGVVTVLLNWRLTPAELEYILGDCSASMVLYDSDFSAAVEPIKSTIPAGIFLRYGGSGPDPEFESVMAAASGEEPVIAGGGDEPVLIMYTSGTTGKPKGAVLSHYNLFWASLGLTHTLRWAHKDRYLLAAPLFHIGGLAPFIANVHVGCTTFFMPDFHPARVWQTIAEKRINFMMTVPLMLQAMMMAPDFEKTDLSSLRHFICGGSAVPQKLILAYHEKGIKISHVYGATEYSGAITFWTHDMGLEQSDSMGRPVFHGDVKVLKPGSDVELPAGEIGELCLYGPQVFTGYWGNEAASREVIGDGFYRSGDLGKKDENGFVYVLDRLKDMIISGGENIYPAEIESVLQGHPSVAEAAVVGRPDDRWGEIPVAFIVPRSGSDATEAGIYDHCRKNLAGYKCIKDLYFVEAIPKNATGKVLKKALRDQLAASAE